MKGKRQYHVRLRSTAGIDDDTDLMRLGVPETEVHIKLEGVTIIESLPSCGRFGASLIRGGLE